MKREIRIVARVYVRATEREGEKERYSERRGEGGGESSITHDVYRYKAQVEEERKERTEGGEKKMIDVR